MSAFDMDPRLRWAFCMTHPDDEISICAFIRRLVLNGNPVFMSWTHSTEVREREGRSVASILGVPDEHLHFFHARDGNVVDEIHEVLPSFRELFARVQPDRVCCGAFEQGHIDHDSTNWMVAHSFSGPIFEIPFYHTYLTRLQTLNRFSDPSGEEVIRLAPEEQQLKRRVAHQYPSQNIWSVLLWYEVWQVMRLRGMQLARTERMRRQTNFEFCKPAHESRLARRIESSPQWQRWIAAMRDLDSESNKFRNLGML